MHIILSCYLYLYTISLALSCVRIFVSMQVWASETHAGLRSRNSMAHSRRWSSPADHTHTNTPHNSKVHTHTHTHAAVQAPMLCRLFDASLSLAVSCCVASRCALLLAARSSGNMRVASRCAFFFARSKYLHGKWTWTSVTIVCVFKICSVSTQHDCISSQSLLWKSIGSRCFHGFSTNIVW